MKNNNENVIISPLNLKKIEDKKMEKLVEEYLELDDQINDNIDKLEKINKKLAIMYSNLEK
ncbi:hypothetical protein ES702_03445 [subsurface metagenome]